MRKTNPYPNGNFAYTEDFLEEIIKILSGETGRSVIGEASGGFERIVLTGFTAVSLTVPSDATGATLMIEADENTTNPNKVARFKENGTPPTSIEGFFMESGLIMELNGKDRLDDFSIIAIDGALTHIVHVQYFKSNSQNPS